jgi:hypothetical protein
LLHFAARFSSSIFLALFFFGFLLLNLAALFRNFF